MTWLRNAEKYIIRFIFWEGKVMTKRLQRGAGVLLPISSLPSPYGIGTLGKAAFDFVDWLQKAGQTYWQVLPVGPTSYGDSPYQSYSAFAGNPYFIDLDILVSEDLLSAEEVNAEEWYVTPEYVEYGTLYEERFDILRKAFERSGHEDTNEYRQFVEENKDWLEDYALFMAIKNDYDGKGWQEWEDEIKLRKPEVMAVYKEELEEEIDFYKFLQFKFFEQWAQVKKYANSKGIKIIGDIPIYVALDSADVWANPKQFLLDEKLKPVNVAGCPPDAFTSYGQKWGNPIYNWELMEQDDFSWWKKRMSSSSKLYDVIRIDHFIGIVRYFNIPVDKDPKDGFYKDGPAIKLVNAIDSAIGDSKIIAEDLGVFIPEVAALIEQSGYPGMKVLEFAFDGGTDNVHLPHNYIQNCVCYVGTHDNEMLESFVRTSEGNRLKYMMGYLGADSQSEIPDAMIRCAMASVADTVIIQMQDLLKKNNWARMNEPSAMGKNWKWRMRTWEATDEIARKLKDLTKAYGRYSVQWYFAE